MIPFYKQIGAELNGRVFETRYLSDYCDEYTVYHRLHEEDSPVMIKFLAFNKTCSIQLVGLDDGIEIGMPFKVAKLNKVLDALL